MADPTPSDYHLTYLRERWERDRSSRVFLQLAEEYRRRGLLAEALEVLQVGLSHHPGYLAAQVSLGRCWIEAGKPGAAAEVLSGVLTQDPTQAVASRLLIDVWLRLGEAERARAAIERCELLGVPPLELQGHRERLAQLAADRESAGMAAPAVDPAAPSGAVRPETTPAGDAPMAAAAPEAEPPAPVAAAPAAVPPDLPSAAAAAPEAMPAAGQVFALPPLAAPPLQLPRRPAFRRLLRVGGGDPFQLPVPVTVAPAAGAVFALGLAAAAAPAHAFVPAAPPPAALEAPLFEPAEESVVTPAPELAVATPAPEPIEARRVPDPFAPVQEEPLAPAEALASPLRITAVPEPSAEPRPPDQAGPALEEPLAPSAPAEAPWWRVPTPESSTVPGGDAGVEAQPSGSLPAPELRPSDPGTATLGELYLRQGHLGEAGRIFHQVLERDPDNEVALRGLEAIARRRTTALGADELMSGAPGEVKGLTSRKIVLLQRYLRQIRTAATGRQES